MTILAAETPFICAFSAAWMLQAVPDDAGLRGGMVRTRGEGGGRQQSGLPRQAQAS
jgi:hypothetical protein